jgi:hypothetical protein
LLSIYPFACAAPLQAARLRERLILLLALHAGDELLKPVWAEQALLTNRMGDLPVWWSPAQDVDLVQGLLLLVG